MLTGHSTRWLENPGRRTRERELAELGRRWLPPEDIAAATREIQGWPGYRRQRPVALPGLAAACGIGAIHYQDEGLRFGLESFKGWGGGYATSRLLSRHPGAVAACATDGNHGRAIAWAARTFGGRAVVYMAEVASAHAERIVRELGAEVLRVDGNHEVASAACREAAVAGGWFIVTETENATEPEIALDTMAGYGALWAEAMADFDDEPPTHLFVQAGVGGLSATAAAYTAARYGARRPVLTVVEAESADCIRRSLAAGRRVDVEGEFETRLAGLAAGATSTYAFELLSAGADFAMTIRDEAAHDAMRRLACPPSGDPVVVGGGSGVSGLAGALVACATPELRADLGLEAGSSVLVIGTEGATDPERYEGIVGVSPADLR